MPTETISHYRIVKRLGAGGMGEVFLAEDLQLERRVAVKILAPELARDPEKRKRFRHEAKAASALAHPNVCVVHEVGESRDGRPFLAMEYIEGKRLDELIQHRALTTAQIIEVGLGVAEALDAAHARHLVHRDIKPSNIMLDRRGQVKVLDFGVAKTLTPPGPEASSSALRTSTGQLLGTPAYMSPEQLLGRPLDPRSDIFSLGVVLYEALLGQRPFLGATLGEIINNALNQQPKPLELADARFSPKLDQIVLRCLEKDPGNRYPSARALGLDLAEVREQAERARTKDAAPGAEFVAPQPAPKLWLLAHRRPQPLRQVLLYSGVALCVVVTALVFLMNRRGPASAAGNLSSMPVERSVAVLPFDNFSGERDTDFLSDGLTEEITEALTHVPNLKVAARNSAFTFKGHKEDARKIAAALHVSSLLEGSLRKSGNQIKVTAELINAADGFDLWSDNYVGTVDDLFGVQEKIARQIALRLQGETRALPVQSSRVPAEVHQLYLRGRYYWNKRTDDDLKQSIDLFREAVKRAPDYADAHAALASAYFVRQLNSIKVTPQEYRPLARAEAERALSLDPGSAEAHAVLGWLQYYANDKQGAEHHLARALELAPNFATAHQWYGLYFVYTGRLGEALPELQKAADLDPLSPVIQMCIPTWYFYKRDFDETIRQAKDVIDRFPEFPLARFQLVEARLAKGQFNEALEDINEARKLPTEDSTELLASRAYALARLGRTAEAREILAQFEELARKGERVQWPLTAIHMGLGEYDLAVADLEQARQTGGLDDSILYDPGMDELRHRPGFDELLKRAGLKP